MEEWKPVKESDGRYMISSDGRVFSRSSNRMLRPADNGYGYKKTILRIGGRAACRYIHRLVAEAFLPRLPGQTEVDHIDGNRVNNCVSNLRWVTHSENQLNMTQRGRNNKAKLSVEAVRMIRKRSAEGVSGPKIAREFGITHPAVYKILRGEHYAWVKQ